MTPMLALSTFPSPDVAANIAKTLVEEQLAACVNLVPGVRSIYRWEGKLSDDEETLGIIKTTRERFDALRARLVELHPYELPEVVALAIADGHAPYLAWVTSSVR